VVLGAGAARAALADGPPAVLVGHSMGGMAVTQAAARCSELVASLVYIGAFAPAPGQSLGELVSWPEAAGDQVQANLVVQGDPPVGILPAQAAKDALFNCCDAERADWAAARLGPQPIRPFGDPVQLDAAAGEAFARIPRAYIVCTQDRAISPAMQRRMLTQIGCDPVIELDADHWPWVSAPDGFVAAIDRLASAH
jgi:pimeloyl-ACP methyl ester carboxylesterase